MFLNKNMLTTLMQRLCVISPIAGDDKKKTDEDYKFILLHILSYMGIVLLTSYGIPELLHKNYSLAAWDIGTATIIIVNLIYARRSGNYKTIMYADIFIVGVLLEYLFITGGVNNTGHLWIYTFPLFTLFMLGLFTGTIVTAVFLTIPIMVLYIPNLPVPVYEYSVEFKLRFLGSFLLVFVFTFFYEFVRETTQHKIDIRNKELEAALTNQTKTDMELKLAHDKLEAKVAVRTRALTEANNELTTALSDLKHAQFQLLQTEKLASIGQLASGIAHEINTPTQYVGDNTHFFQESFSELSELLAKYRLLYEESKNGSISPKLLAEIRQAIEVSDVDYLMHEIPVAIRQSLDGVARVTRIVSAMKEFAHPDSGDKTLTDINKAIENTITVSRNEWKYVAVMKTMFDDDLPQAPCNPGEFNQVILNIIINAAQAIGEIVGNDPKKRGLITVTTKHDGDWAEIRISDTGDGIPEQVRTKIFDHFFTTKEVGKGTGQGLAISHNVIVEKHGGTLTFETTPGEGTTFIIRLPILDGKMQTDQ